MSDLNRPDMRPRDEGGHLLDPQARAYEEMTPAKYSSTARLIQVSMWLDESMPCWGGECDEFGRCAAHECVDEMAQLILDAQRERSSG